MSKKSEVFLEKGPGGYLKITDAPGKRRNDAMLCLCHGHIWFKMRDRSPRYLLGEIKHEGFDVLGDKNFTKLAKGQRPCVGGTGYVGKLSFPDAQDKEKNSTEMVAPARKFLGRFFKLIEMG